MLTRKSKIADIQANSTSYERAKYDRKRAKKRPSPDVQKMTSIFVPGLRATFYPAGAKKIAAKIKELEAAGYEIIVRKPLKK